MNSTSDIIINNMDNMDFEQLSDWMKYLYPKIYCVYQFANNNRLDERVMDIDIENEIDSVIGDEIYMSDTSEIYKSDDEDELIIDNNDCNEKEFCLHIESGGPINMIINTVVKEDISENKTPLQKIHFIINYEEGADECEMCNENTCVMMENVSHVENVKMSFYNEIEQIGDQFKLVIFKNIK